MKNVLGNVIVTGEAGYVGNLLMPLTHYNRFKGICGPLLFKQQGSDSTCVTIHPSTLLVHRDSPCRSQGHMT